MLHLINAGSVSWHKIKLVKARTPDWTVKTGIYPTLASIGISNMFHAVMLTRSCSNKEIIKLSQAVKQ